MSAAFFVAIAISTASMGPTSNVSYVRTTTDGIVYPARIAPTPGGGIYVTDPPMKLFVEYGADGVKIGTHAIAEGAVGIAVHTAVGDGRIFISRDDGKIGVYSSAFAPLGTVNPAPLTLTGPNDLAFDATTNELYTVDSGSHRVLVFAESGVPPTTTWTLARSWGMEGSGMGEFAAPQAIALNTTLGQVIVTDADNFRVQVFNTNGILLFKFGYRTLYLPTSDVAWFARSEGVAVDACNNIYIADALMGTVRVFSSIGKELSATYLPAVTYGTGTGQLREPCDVAIDGAGMMYVASTNNGAVEVFNVACAATASTSEPADESRSSRKSAPVDRRAADGRTAITPVAVVQPRLPDNPLEIVAVINNGEYCVEFDFDRDNIVGLADLQFAVSAFGAGTVEDFWNMGNGVASNSHPALSPPHILDMPNACGRCHSMDGSPGGMLTADGQENLCQSCHSAGKIAGEAWIGPGDLAMNHPWGEPAANADPGPAPGSDIALHLDAGNVRCATCHDPHETSQGTCVVPSPIPGSGFPAHIGTCVDGAANGSPCQKDSQCSVNFMRTEGTKIELCGECHVQYEEWERVGHGEQHADPWGHYDWSMGNNWLCTGPGTPYAYCTGESAGRATSAGSAVCTDVGAPLTCCTGPGTGTCTIANSSCTGLGTPWACCTGTGAGNCANNLSAAACTGAGTPMACCTGAGTGNCSDRAACRQCHSGNGYIDFANDFPDGTVNTATHRGSFRVADCLVCHTTHGKAQGQDLLRIYGTVRLPTGQEFSGVGPGATCMACHNGRTGPPVQNTTTSLSTPHYLLGGVMLEGVNGYTFGNTSLENSAHTAQVGCTDCHMAPGPTLGPEVGKVGGHSFRLKDHDSGFENVENACQRCHAGLTTINREARGDYDGDGATEGVQDEVSGLLAAVLAQLQAKGAVQLAGYPYWNLNAVLVADRILVKNAIWNWEYVDNSGDLGIKNTAYAVGLLQLTYENLVGAVLPNAYLRYVPTGQTASVQYTGTNACLTCHGAMAVTGTDYSSFLRSGHPYKLSEIKDGQMPTFPFSSIAGALGLVTDNDGEVGDPNAGPDNTLPAPSSYADVSYVIGGFGWKARWVDLAGYILTGTATQFNLETGGMSAYNNNQVDKKYDCGACHVTGWKDYTSATGDTRNLNRQKNLPGMAGTWYDEGIQCEACHGGGSFHVAAPSASNITKVATALTTADLTAPDMAYGKPRACSDCHTRDGEKIYPTYVPAGNRIKASGGFIQHHEQYDEMVGINPDDVPAGPTGPHKDLACTDCHNTHTTTKYMDVSGDPPGMYKACTECHNPTGVGAKNYELQLLPPVGMAGLVTCVDCHMPKLVKSAVSYPAVGSGPSIGDIRAHMFEIDLTTISQFTGSGAFAYPWVTGPYACNHCHNGEDEFGLTFPNSVTVIHDGSH